MSALAPVAGYMQRMDAWADVVALTDAGNGGAMREITQCARQCGGVGFRLSATEMFGRPAQNLLKVLLGKRCKTDFPASCHTASSALFANDDRCPANSSAESKRR